MTRRDIVVLGASAGGIEAVKEILGRLPEGFPAAVFVVIHVSPTSPGTLPHIFGRRTRLAVAHAADGAPIQAGRVYVAPPDHHVLLHPDGIRLTRGPRENMARPSVDTMFRSAAVHFGPRVIGVVLTGGLDDGAAGLSAIKRCGGIAVVQDPNDALFPSMPRNALLSVQVDHQVPLVDVAALLERLAGGEVKDPAAPAPPIVALEDRISEMEDAGDDLLDQIGTPSSLTCPECGGSLWELKDSDPLRYRCHVGHALSAQALLAQQSSSIEEAVWAAIRQFDENAMMCERLVERCRQRGQDLAGERFQQRATRARQYGMDLRALLQTLPSVEETPA